MILGDLLGHRVLDADGARLGTVIDVRFVIDGSPHAPLADARLYGLIVSPRTSSSYWGYERTTANAPAVIARFLAWRHRGTFLVPWSSVALIDDEVVHLARDHEELDPAL